MTRRQQTGLWIALNVLGAAVYLLVASRAWSESALATLTDADMAGNAFVWFLTAVPIVAAFGLLNLGTLTWAVVKRRADRRWPFSSAVWLVPLVWVGAVIVDFAHH